MVEESSFEDGFYGSEGSDPILSTSNSMIEKEEFKSSTAFEP